MKRASFSAQEAQKYGVHPSVLAYYAKTGVLARICRGIYCNPRLKCKTGLQWAELVIIAQSIPSGVVCLISALALYGLTDEILREHWIAVSNKSQAPKRPQTRIVRMRNTHLGKVAIKINGQKIAIFNRERTIVDSFRCLTKEIAIKALKRGLQKRGPHKLDLRKLRSYGKKLRFNLDAYILTATT